MVRAHPWLRIPGPDRLPLRLQHLWEDVGANELTRPRGEDRRPLVFTGVVEHALPTAVTSQGRFEVSRF
jgi:hypothetical protein